ncbi:MoaD/ThiS family protein [Candidatus Bathyarchaeota archaeon]|nr:MoaD/ThiS family protein [Candidatus Bathyarchaeota archaeon]
MVISVEVRFLGTFQRLSGKKRFKLKLEEPATVKKVITKLTETFSSEFKRALVDPQLDDPRPNALILVGGKEINVLQGLETEVKDAEEIVLVPMVHGG